MEIDLVEVIKESYKLINDYDIKTLLGEYNRGEYIEGVYENLSIIELYNMIKLIEGEDVIDYFREQQLAHIYNGRSGEYKDNQEEDKGNEMKLKNYY